MFAPLVTALCTLLAPYGVRAGAKTLGRKDPTKQATRPRVNPEEGVFAHL